MTGEGAGASVAVTSENTSVSATGAITNPSRSPRLMVLLKEPIWMTRSPHPRMASAGAARPSSRSSHDSCQRSGPTWRWRRRGCGNGDIRFPVSCVDLFSHISGIRIHYQLRPAIHSSITSKSYVYSLMPLARESMSKYALPANLNTPTSWEATHLTRHLSDRYIRARRSKESPRPNEVQIEPASVTAGTSFSGSNTLLKRFAMKYWTTSTML